MKQWVNAQVVVVVLAKERVDLDVSNSLQEAIDSLKSSLKGFSATSTEPEANKLKEEMRNMSTVMQSMDAVVERCPIGADAESYDMLLRGEAKELLQKGSENVTVWAASQVLGRDGLRDPEAGLANRKKLKLIYDRKMMKKKPTAILTADFYKQVEAILAIDKASPSSGPPAKRPRKATRHVC